MLYIQHKVVEVGDTVANFYVKEVRRTEYVDENKLCTRNAIEIVVHHDTKTLLGISLRNQCYVSTTLTVKSFEGRLPFGSRGVTPFRIMTLKSDSVYHQGLSGEEKFSVLFKEDKDYYVSIDCFVVLTVNFEVDLVITEEDI